jgi:predicted dehydrogenase
MIQRIVIIGYGSIGKRHLLLARELLPAADIRLYRHSDISVDSVPAEANAMINTHEQLLEFAPQLAVIANPAPFHIEMALLLAHAGAHLLIEKPLSTDSQGIAELLSICRDKQLVCLLGYNLRFLPSLNEFRRLLNDGAIGNILSVRCEIGQYLPSWRPDADYRQSVSARRELGGGVLLELSHELDYLRWIFGEVEWINATVKQQSELEINVEDVAYLTLGFSATKTGNEFIGALTMDFLRHDTTRMCVAIGDAGSLRWNALTGVVDQFDKDGSEWQQQYVYHHPRNTAYLAEWQHLLDCITGNDSPLIDAEDGLRVLEIVEAARISADSGWRVAVKRTSVKE